MQDDFFTNTYSDVSDLLWPEKSSTARPFTELHLVVTFSFPTLPSDYHHHLSRAHGWLITKHGKNCETALLARQGFIKSQPLLSVSNYKKLKRSDLVEEGFPKSWNPCLACSSHTHLFEEYEPYPIVISHFGWLILLKNNQSVL